MKLYHYTCKDRIAEIEAAGFLTPHGVLPETRLVWLTDLEYPDRDALGLTQHMAKCDRAEYRITVDCDFAEHWFKYRRNVRESIRDGLETAPGTASGNWYVTTAIVPILKVEHLR